jgi:hypothetical protein
MSEDNTPTVEELQSKLDAATAAQEAAVNEQTAMKAKMDELLSETKKAKGKQKEIEAAAAAEAERIAKANKDFEQLYKSAEERYNNTVQELEGMKTKAATKEVRSTAVDLATRLADGHNVQLLSEFVAKRLTFHEDSVKITDGNGNLTVATLDDLADEFQKDTRFTALLKGNQASGGGASGGSNGGGAAKVMSRSDFEDLNAADRMKFIKSGGKLTD